MKNIAFLLLSGIVTGIIMLDFVAPALKIPVSDNIFIFMLFALGIGFMVGTISSDIR